MENYQLILLDNNRGIVRVFFWFLFFLQVTAVALVLSFSADQDELRSALTFSIIYLIFLALWLMLRKTAYAVHNQNIGLQVAYIIFWFVHSGLPAALICTLVLIFAVFLSRKKSKVIISTTAVSVLIGISNRVYLWPDIETCLLKDQLLTLDLKNNHFIQSELAPESRDVDENGFNIFCRRQLQPG